MNADKMREEFEAAYVEKTCSFGAHLNTDDMKIFRKALIRVVAEDWDGEGYVSNEHRIGWWAWQASREAVVIDLPVDNKDRPSSVSCALHACKQAVEAAGLKVKP